MLGTAVPLNFATVAVGFALYAGRICGLDEVGGVIVGVVTGGGIIVVGVLVIAVPPPLPPPQAIKAVIGMLIAIRRNTLIWDLPYVGGKSHNLKIMEPLYTLATTIFKHKKSRCFSNSQPIDRQMPFDVFVDAGKTLCMWAPVKTS